MSRFESGKPALDQWLKTRALSNQQRGFTVVMVVHDDHAVVGNYGLAPTAVIPTSLPRSIRTGQPPDPVPCLLLGQLAVDRRYAGRGIGNGLLKHALQRCLAGATLIGGRALLVHAVDEDAIAYWLHHGFTQTKDDRFLLVRSIAEIAASQLKAGR